MGWRWAVVLTAGVCACGDGDGLAQGDDNAEIPDAHVVTDARSATPDARVDGSILDRDGGVAGSDARVKSSDAGAASWLLKPGEKVFFVGNSFIAWEDRVMTDWLAAVGDSVSPKVSFQTGSHVVAGTNKLDWFLQQPESQNAINSGNWDVFVLQGEDTEAVYDDSLDTDGFSQQQRDAAELQSKLRFWQAVRDYNTAITAHGGRTMLFMTWSFKWFDEQNDDWYQKLVSAYDDIGKELNIPVIPVGVIYHDTVKDPNRPDPDPWFLTGGALHETASGMAVNTYATFMMLTGVNPNGVTFTATNQDNTPAMLKYLSDKSWTRVSQRLAGATSNP